MNADWKTTSAAAFVGLLVGMGTANYVVIAQVNENKTNIANMKDDFSQEKQRTDDRIFKLADLLNGVIKQNSEFVSLIREQNALTRQLIEIRK